MNPIAIVVGVIALIGILVLIGAIPGILLVVTTQKWKRACEEVPPSYRLAGRVRYMLYWKRARCAFRKTYPD